MHVLSTLLVVAVAVAVTSATAWAEEMIPQTASPALGNLAWSWHAGGYGGLFGMEMENYGGAPEPTQGPSIIELMKRQSDEELGSTCGIFATNTSWTYSCLADDYCGFNAASGRFGCCTASLGPESLTGCYFPTTCVDSSAFTDTCTETGCGWSTLYCTSADYPYCGKLVKGTFTASDCFTEPGASYVLIATDGDTEPSITSSSSSFFTSSLQSLTTSSSQSSSQPSETGPPPSRVPFTETQQTVGSSSSANSASTSTVVSKALAARLGDPSEQFYGFWMSLFMFIL